MSYVDSAILNLIERACRRFQVWTGRTNVWLAFHLTNLSIVVYFLWVAGLYWLSASMEVRLFVAFFCGGVFVVLTRTIFKTSIEAAETEAYRRVASGLRNPRRIRDAQLRIAFLTLSIALSYPLWFLYVTLGLRFALLTEALIDLTTVILYVLACDPLPPCAGKVREWLRGMATAKKASADVGLELIAKVRKRPDAAHTADLPRTRAIAVNGTEYFASFTMKDDLIRLCAFTGIAAE